MTAFGRYFVPGPSEVHPQVLDAMRRPMFHHRSPEAAALYERIQAPLREVFGTRQNVHVFAASGTGAMEAGARSVPAGRVLSLVNGAFSGRFARVAEKNGHEVERFEVDWGEVHDPQAVADRLRGGDFSAVTVVHSETSTGALQPIAALAAATGGVPLLVDTVSSAGGAPIAVDEAGLAYAFTGSQKALALPPGLSFAVAAPRLLELAAQAPARGHYFDLLHFEKKTPPFTPALPQLFALETQLERIARAGGVPARWARHAEMAQRTWRWVGERGLEVLAPEGARSPTVTCIRLAEAPAFVERIRQETGYTLGAGYGRLKETTFRIGHMGDQTPETLEGLLAACDAVLAGS